MLRRFGTSIIGKRFKKESRSARIYSSKRPEAVEPDGAATPAGSSFPM
jgi:hypothetical protein